MLAEGALDDWAGRSHPSLSVLHNAALAKAKSIASKLIKRGIDGFSVADLASVVERACIEAPDSDASWR